MSGKNPQIDSLASRKQLLIAESELNREQLAQDWQTISAEIHGLAERARTVRSLALAAASLLAGLAVWRRKKSAPSAEKSSWLQTILKYTPIAGSLWSAFNARPKS